MKFNIGDSVLLGVFKSNDGTAYWHSGKCQYIGSIAKILRDMGDGGYVVETNSGDVMPWHIQGMTLVDESCKVTMRDKRKGWAIQRMIKDKKGEYVWEFPVHLEIYPTKPDCTRRIEELSEWASNLRCVRVVQTTEVIEP